MAPESQPLVPRAMVGPLAGGGQLGSLPAFSQVLRLMPLKHNRGKGEGAAPQVTYAQ